jgi:hypothetical protein
VTLTLREHILRRFPADRVDIACAWHRNTFTRSLMTPSPDLKVRQVHYVGHGSGGGLLLGYNNQIRLAARQQLADALQWWPISALSPQTKRAFVLSRNAGLMSGFFDILPAPKLAAIKAQLAPASIMHIWGCLAGAPDHIFDRDHEYWDVLNSAGSPVPGIARHVARALGVELTAVLNTAVMNSWYRVERGRFQRNNCPQRPPGGLWPTRSATWVTSDRSVAGNQRQINYMGASVAASRLQPTQPPQWFLNEIPLSRATRRPSAAPACSAIPVAIWPAGRWMKARAA